MDDIRPVVVDGVERPTEGIERLRKFAWMARNHGAVGSDSEDVVGYIEKIEARLKAAEERVERLTKLYHDPCLCGECMENQQLRATNAMLRKVVEALRVVRDTPEPHDEELSAAFAALADLDKHDKGE